MELNLWGSLVMGVGCFVACRTVVGYWLAPKDDLPDDWRYDRVRMSELRAHDTLYRWLQPLFVSLGSVNRVIFRNSLPAVQRELLAAGWPRFWIAEEYLARCEIIALMLLPLLLAAGLGIGGSAGVVLSLVMTGLIAWLLRQRLAALARRRLREIKRRLPYFLDMLTLLMEAGASLTDALDHAVNEFQGQPVAEEFGRVQADIRFGRTRPEAMLAMRDRLQDAEVGSVIGSILQGEHLGTPLAQVFRMQADVLRVKRTQRAEAVAAEAGVQMLLPGVLVMAAAVLIILGPFVLNYLTFGFTL